MTESGGDKNDYFHKMFKIRVCKKISFWAKRKYQSEHRDWSPKFETGLNIVIGIDQKV